MSAPTLKPLNRWTLNWVIKLASGLAYCFILIALTLVIFRSSPITSQLVVYQERWAPALTLACLDKFGVFDFSRVPPAEAAAAQSKINEFLSRTPVPTFDCSSIPSETQVAALSSESNHMRWFYRYSVGLMASVGALWHLFGPSWEILGLYSAFLAAVTLLLLFAVSRQFVGPLWAAAIAAFVGTNKLFLFMIPFTRDFSKAPFVIAVFYLLMKLIMQRYEEERFYLINCITLAILLGIGVTFRQDMVAGSVLCIIFLGLFPPDIPVHSTLQLQAKGIALFTISFLAFLIPLFNYVPVEHGTEGHLVILGLFDGAFQYAQFPLGNFTFNPSYEDYSGNALIAAYGAAKTGAADITTYSLTYNTLSIHQFAEFALTFPFVIVGRIYTIAYDIATSASYLAAKDSWIGSIIGRLAGGHLLLSVVAFSAFVSALVKNRRLFYFLFFYLLASGAILSLQYMERHFFHLHLLWFTLSCSIAISYIRTIFRPTPRSLFVSGAVQEARNSMRFPLTSFGIALAIPIVSYGLQKVTLNEWIKKVQSSHYDGVSFSLVPSENAGRVIARISTAGEFPNFAGQYETYDAATKRPWTMIGGGFLRARFKSSAQCGKETRSMRALYQSKFRYFDLSHSTAIGETQAFEHYFPAFFSEDSRFVGVEIDAESSSCLESLSWSSHFATIKLPVEFTGPLRQTP